MELVTANLSGKTRWETLAGKEYLVAPATLIVPGVLNGNKGPLFYPEEEVSKEPWNWNNVPIVLYHPSKGSARVPRVLNSQGLGYVFNAHYVDGALKAELWFDVARSKEIAPKVFEQIQNGEALEISTGLKTSEREVPEGTTFNSPIRGEVPYRAVAFDYRPDHLAILPDMLGACSIADGCGVNNELSQDDLNTSLQGLLNERLGEGDHWIADVYKTYLIYRTPDGFFRLGYSIAKGGEVSLSTDTATPVERRTVYEPVSNQDGQVGSSDFTKLEESNMTPDERKKIVDGLISNSCCWGEEDRKELEAMTDNALRRTKEASEKATENEELVAAAEKGFEAGNGEFKLNRKTGKFEPIKKEEPTNNASALSEADRLLLNKAAEIIKRDEAKQEAEKEQTINALISRYPEDQRAEKRARFNGMTLEQLQTVAEMATPAKNHYGPTRTVPAQRSVAVENTVDGVTNKNEDDDMLTPEIDWAENSVFAKK